MMIVSAITDFDTHLLFLINHARCGFLDVAMPVLSDFKMLLPVLVPFLAYRLWRGDNRERLLWIVVIAAVAFSDVLCAKVIKVLVGRPRPYEVHDGLYVYRHSRWMVTDPAFRAGISATLAWPSCHATNMWTAASYLIAWWGRRAVPVALLAVLVCWSRIYLGVHYPLDVAGGTVLGIILGISFWKAGSFLILENSAE